VLVDVSVTRGQTPVTGLAAADFSLRDNGTVQLIESVGDAAMPLDVSLVIDATWFTQGQVGASAGPVGTRALHENARQLAALLTPRDALGVSTVGAKVEVTRPMSPFTADQAISVANTTTPMFEDRPRITQAVLTALTRAVSPDRRHIVVAFSTARGAMDAPSGAPLAAVAARADALLYVVMNPPLYDLAHVPFAFRPSEITIRDALAHAAEATGGRAFLTGDILASFRDVLNEFRQRYVLRYSVQGTPTRGWHDIVVSVPKCLGCTVHARRGYMGQ
jgi:VWFA-related protein